MGKALYNIDLREHGSGNAGATNTFRVLGTKAGIIVLIIDVLKGVGATCIAYFTPMLASGMLFFRDLVNLSM